MLNWTQLVAQGRAKAVGIPWSQEEMDELIKLRDEGTPFMEGAIILRGSKPRKEIEAKAKEAGVEFTPEAPDEVLEKETKAKTSKAKGGKE